MKIAGRDYNIRTGLTIFITISVISSLILMFLGMDRNTWTNLMKLKPEFNLLATLFMFAQWYFNSIRFKILVNSLGNNVSLWTSFKAFMANIFLSAITPSQTGGGVIQVYILNRNGVSLSKAFTGCLMGAVLTVVCLVFSSLAILMFRPDLRAEIGHHMAYILIVVSAVFLFMFTLFVLSIFNIKMAKRLIGRWILSFCRAIKYKKGFSIVRRMMRGLDQYSKGMLMFVTKKKFSTLLAGFFTLLSLTSNSLIAPSIMKGLNIESNLFKAFLAQFVLFFISYFSPTPGASGIAEFSNYWMMNSLGMDQNMIGVYTVIWRFYTSFIGVAVGGIIVLSLTRRKKKPLDKVYADQQAHLASRD